MTAPANAKLSKIHTARLGARAGATLVALVALSVPLVLTGCGGGGGKTSNRASASRAATGTVTFNVVWPERTRLIPRAANSIVVTLNRRTDADIPAGIPAKSITLVRPAAGQPLMTTASFTTIETGTYDITATSYPGNNGPEAVNPGTGTGVPLSTTRTGVFSVTVVADATVTQNVTMDSTVATLTPGLPADFVQTPGSSLPNAVSATPVTRIRPGQILQLSAAAFDATPSTANPAGPYRVMLSPGGVSFTSNNPAVVSVDPTTGVATAQNVTVESTAIITVADTESGKAGTLSITVTPVGLSTTAPWAKFHGSVQNTGVGVSPALLTAAPKLTTFPTTSRFQFASPVVGADGTTYIGTFTKGSSAGDQKLFALTSAGALKWTFAAGGDIDSAPVIGADGTIFFGTTNGKLYAVRDNGTPQVLWTVDLNAVTTRTTPIFVSPTIDRNGVLYIATSSPDNRVYAFDSLTGTRVTLTSPRGVQFWEVQTTDQVTSTPALSPNQDALFVGDNSANFYRIATGIPARPGIVYSSSAGITAQIALDSGATPGTQEGIGASPVYVPNLGDGRAAVFVATTGSNRLLALDPTTLATLTKPGSTDEWVVDTGGAVFSTPAVSPDGKLLFYATQDYYSGIFDHKVTAIYLLDGSTAWRTPEPDAAGNPYFSDGFNASPTLNSDGSQLYIAGFNGVIYGFSATAPSGGADNARTPLFTVSSPTAAPNQFLGSPALRADGTVVIGGDDGLVYFVR